MGLLRIELPLHCYKIFVPATNWLAAESACSGFGGHLASVRSQAVNDLIQQLAMKKTTSTVLLGGKKKNGGSELEYQNFAPNDQIINGDCILLRSQTGQWIPVECSSPVLAFVCQMDNL